MEPSSDIDWNVLRTDRPRSRWHNASAEWHARLAEDRRVRHFALLEDLLTRFTPGERLALYALTALLGISTLALIAGISKAISVEIPADGGALVEGETTPARFVNPVLASSQADMDVAALVYSGLVRAQPDGSFIPDLAESYSISQDGTVYTFILRQGATFHDGTPVSAADVLYTVALAQNPDVKSPRRADWEGVQVSSPDPRTIVFTLPHAYAPFIENATLGILPKRLWEKVPPSGLPFSTLNTHPVGTGPFTVSAADTDETGAVTRYDLAPFKRFALGLPHLSRITFLFYSNDEALIKAYESGQVNAIAGLSAANLSRLKRTDAQLVAAPLPRVFGVFFNEGKNPALADISVRAALDAALDKPAIIAKALGGFGTPLDGPLPPGILDDTTPASPIPLPYTPPQTQPQDHTDAARAILRKGGWSWDEKRGTWTKQKLTLRLKLATADSPELALTAKETAAAWQALGIPVSLQIYPLSEFNNTILRPRDYEAILFGEVVGRDADLFAFWHSSQRNDPGLNLALYANAKADALLSQGRAEESQRVRAKLYQQFAAIVEKDMPAAFLYSPTFLYIIPSELKGVEIGALTSAPERFLNAYQWYTETQRVWEFFTP